MNLQQARRLYGEVASELTNTQVRLQQIGNGEWVVIVDGYFFLWEKRDWYAHAAMWLGEKYIRRYGMVAEEPLPTLPQKRKKKFDAKEWLVEQRRQTSA